jgi:hypothetical protein
MPGRRKPPPLTRIFTLEELAAMLAALHNHAGDFDADEQPAVWNMEDLIALEISRHHWTKKETRELRHRVAVESINRKIGSPNLKSASRSHWLTMAGAPLRSRTCCSRSNGRCRWRRTLPAASNKQRLIRWRFQMPVKRGSGVRMRFLLAIVSEH